MELKLWAQALVLLWLSIFWGPGFANEIDMEGLLNRIEANLKINPNLASGLAEQAEQQISENELLAFKPRLLNLQAHIHILSFSLNEAFVKASEAENLSRKLGNKLQLAEAIRRQGIINNFLGFDADAIERLTESLKIHRELDSEYIVHNLQSIGNVYNKHDVWADSLLEIGEQLVETSIAKQNVYFEAQGYGYIINVFIVKEEFQKASRLAEEMQVLFGEDSYNIIFYGAIAELNLGNYEKALSKINHYLDIAKRRNFLPVQMSGKLAKAEILRASGNNEEARELLLNALALQEESGIDYNKQAILNNLANYYKEEGDYARSLEYLQQYIQLKEQAFDDKQAEQLAFSRARLELAQKNKRITQLELSTQISEQKNNYQLIVIVLTGSIVVLLLGLYWRLSIQKRLLQSYSAELQQATEAKSQFLARMSHEIRTPINAIIGLTKLTRKQKLTRQQQDVNLQQVEDSSQTLLGVINDILDFSKIEAGKLHIESIPFELDKIVDQSTRMQMLKAHEKGLELIQYIARDVPLFLKGDALRIQQILNNLISNAVKFTKSGDISVSVNKKYSASGILLEFAVRDTGIGLTETQIEKLFDSFSQADESTTRRFGGTGLGLAICKQLVELMGGKIWVESRANEGSTFYFTVMLEEEIVSNTSKEVPGTQLEDLRVLIVDDVELCRQAAAEVLLRVNINPDLVDSGAKAIEKVRLAVLDKAPYDLVLLDWNMPDIDGIHVASMINQQFPHNKPNIVMLSAYDMYALQEMGNPLGVKGYLEKPINTSSLIDVITEISHSYTPKVRVTQKPQNDALLDLTGINILLVEDNELNRKVAKGFLSETSANVTVAEDGQIALDILSAEADQIDVVLMDVQMPVMDGFTATQKIRNELALSLPVVAMTANAMKGDVEKSIAAGMNAHIPKPIDPGFLFQTLREVLSDKINPAQPTEPHTTDNSITSVGLTTSDGKNGEKTASNQSESTRESLTTHIPEESADPPDLKGKRILLVEDNKLNRKVAVGFLAETDAHISVAKDGEKAVQLLTDNPQGYDLIFMDIQMPGIDGLEACRIIREQLQLTLPVIAMTASSAQKDIDASIAAGMNAYVSKPIDSNILYNVITDIMDSLDAPFELEKNDSMSQEDLSDLLVVDKQQAIFKLKGNEELYVGLVEDFVSMKPYLAKLDEALINGDVKNIMLTVHTYKSALSYIGANALAELGVDIEQQLHDENDVITEGIVESLQKYRLGIVKITEELQV